MAGRGEPPHGGRGGEAWTTSRGDERSGGDSRRTGQVIGHTNALAGSYPPKPVKRHEIIKPGAETRTLGIPTVLDRFVQ